MYDNILLLLFIHVYTFWIWNLIIKSRINTKKQFICGGKKFLQRAKNSHNMQIYGSKSKAITNNLIKKIYDITNVDFLVTICDGLNSRKFVIKNYATKSVRT